MRQPHNVLIVPFYRPLSAEPLFCALQRADSDIWQWVAGGVEEDETIAQAACREAREELGVEGVLFSLDMRAFVPKNVFAAHPAWPQTLYLVEEHAFALELPSTNIRLSAEHRDFAWGVYEEARALLHWQSNQTALWELTERLAQDNLHQVVKGPEDVGNASAEWTGV